MLSLWSLLLLALTIALTFLLAVILQRQVTRALLNSNFQIIFYIQIFYLSKFFHNALVYDTDKNSEAKLGFAEKMAYLFDEYSIILRFYRRRT